MSLMLRYQERVKATGGPSTAAPGSLPVGGSIGDQQLATLLDNALEVDLQSLKDIASIERKNEVKRSELVPKYRPYVEQLREAGVVHPLLGQFTVWLFDIGDIEGGLEIGLYCLEVGAELPERFSRKGGMHTFLADSVLDWSAGMHSKGHSVNPYFESLFFRVSRLEDNSWDIPDALAAKYHKLASLLAEDAGQLDEAIAHLEVAETLGAPVVTRMKALKKAQKAKQSGDTAS